MNQLYQAILMDHYRNPRNATVLTVFDCTAHQHNPLCGDSVAIQMQLDGDKVTALGVQAVGCVICVATCSILSEVVLATHINGICSFDKNTILNLISIPLGPTRLKCALLALDVVQECIAYYQKNR